MVLLVQLSICYSSDNYASYHFTSPPLAEQASMVTDQPSAGCWWLSAGLGYLLVTGYHHHVACYNPQVLGIINIGQFQHHKFKTYTKFSIRAKTACHWLLVTLSCYVSTFLVIGYHHYAVYYNPRALGIITIGQFQSPEI